MIPDHPLDYDRPPRTLGEKVIRLLVTVLRSIADLFFQQRYAHRSVLIETISAIPGMVGGTLLHFRCLRKIKDDEGWIRRLLNEAENERMHLMAFIHLAKPSWFEHFLIYLVQFFFITFYFLLYVCSSRLAHRFVGYLEEEAIKSYSDYLDKIEAGSIENVPAPLFSIHYWQLKKNARLSDLIMAVRKDEHRHRDTNHYFADVLQQK